MIAFIGTVIVIAVALAFVPMLWAVIKWLAIVLAVAFVVGLAWTIVLLPFTL